MKTTTNYAIRYPELSDPPDLPTDLSNLDADVNTALNGLIPDSGVVTNGITITPNTGWSIAKTQYRTIGVKMWALLQCTRTGADITGSSAGNIPDADGAIGTIADTAFRPAMDWYGNYRSALTSGSAQVSSAGNISIVDAHAGGPINTGETLNIYVPTTVAAGVNTLSSTVRDLYFPAGTDRPIGPDDVTQIALTAESIDAALSALIPDTGTRTDAPVTPADGWSVLISEYRLIGKDMTLHVWLQREGSAITASAAGNITGDPPIFTITDPALRPSLDTTVGQFRASITGGAYQIGSDGVANIYDAHSSSSIAAPTSDGRKQTLQVYANYPIP